MRNGAATPTRVLCHLTSWRAGCSYDDFFRVPVGHASVLGVIKPFWEQHLRPAKTTLDTGDDIRITTAQKATMKERHRQLVSTSCYNINLPDIITCAPTQCLRHSSVTCRGQALGTIVACLRCSDGKLLQQRHVHACCRGRSQMTMSDWATWSEVVAPYVLLDSGVDERIMDMWHELRTGLLYFLRYQPGQHTEAAIDDAQNHLLRYAALVERNYGIARKALVTHQLHVVCVHFAEQARQWGPLAFAAEWWVERLMQRFKRITKYRTTRFAADPCCWLLVAFAVQKWHLVSSSMVSGAQVPRPRRRQLLAHAGRRVALQAAPP